MTFIFFSFQILFANHKYEAEIDRVSAKGKNTCVESKKVTCSYHFSKVVCHSFLVVKNLSYMLIILSVFHSNSQSNEVIL